MSTSSLGVDRIADLEIFVRIVERGSLTAAGISLGMTTPLVSRRLSALEQSLGARLIDRNSRMLVLTEHGREFHGRAAEVLRILKEARNAVKQTSQEITGTLRISLPTSASEGQFLTHFVRLFLDHPGLNIEVHLSDRPVDVVALGLDAAFYLTDAPDRHPGDTILGGHPTCLAACPDYLNQAGRPSHPDELASHRTIRAVSNRGKVADWSLKHIDGHETVVAPCGPLFLTDDLRVAVAAVVDGAGIGRMPLGVVAQGAARGRLEVVLPEWRFRPVVLASSLRRGGRNSARLALLLSVISSQLERIQTLAENTPLADYFRQQVRLNAGDLPLPPSD